MNEFQTKITRLRRLLSKHSLDAMLLQRTDNFAWATCGASSFVNQAATLGAASLLITQTEQHLIADNIEATRLEQEEHLGAQGWQFHISPWYEAVDQIGALTRGTRLAADGPYANASNLEAEVAGLRADLTGEEIARFRTLGTACAQAMHAAIGTVRPGMSEVEIAGELDREVRRRGVQPVVNLIGTDERIHRFRHPLPTDKRLERYAMLVLCGRKWGLICSITRLVHFGKLPDDLRKKADATAQVDAAFIQSTRPGRRLDEIFQAGVEAYRRVGFADEWKLHHQGGLAGYAPREIIATPTSSALVRLGQAFAWNPSITGTKSEDTIIVGEKANEVITSIPGWPVLEIETSDGSIARPAIWEQV
jgi:Xaa-Pro aminopeptidase